MAPSISEGDCLAPFEVKIALCCPKGGWSGYVNVLLPFQCNYEVPGEGLSLVYLTQCT